MSSLRALEPVTNPDVCRRFRHALVPNIVVRIFVPDRERDGRALPQLKLVARIQAAFSQLAGGHSSFQTCSAEYRPDRTHGLKEQTIAIDTYLPEVVTEALREQLLDLVLTFGQQARQAEVLVVVGMLAYRFSFARSGVKKEAPRAGISIVPHTEEVLPINGVSSRRSL